jgi:hypothetical protein
MHRKIWLAPSLFLVFATEGFGQQYLQGRVIKKGSSEILVGVTIVNLNKKRYVSSDTAGAYSMIASPHDTIVFSSAGYLPDTVFIGAGMRLDDYLVALSPRIASLPSVDVFEMGQYRKDSAERREEYAWLLNTKHPVKLMNEKRAQDPPGLNFSPLGYFSKRETRKRRLKMRLRKEEEDYYVDYKFSPSRVGLLTGLKGDSLRMFLYINDKLAMFKEGRL